MKKTVIDEYSELMHYTSAAGLTGILSSQCIWSTHASHLNDMEETSLFFKDRLPLLAKAIVEKSLANGTLANEPKVTNELLEAICLAIQKVTLRFNEPYIFSMCGAPDERTSRNGLLSQWRAYGRDGGYAIVFDTQGIQAMLESEGDLFHFQYLQWGDVYYNDPQLQKQKSQPEITEAENLVESCILKFLTGEQEHQEEAMGELYQAVTSLSCLYKHWGFQEEREVRIVAIPLNKKVREHADKNRKKFKAQRAFVREGSPVPYIELNPKINSEGRLQLPIKRIVVGPHRNKEQRRKAVELMLSELSIDADVTTSEIPYIG